MHGTIYSDRSEPLLRTPRRSAPVVNLSFIADRDRFPKPTCFQMLAISGLASQLVFLAHSRNDSAARQLKDAGHIGSECLGLHMGSLVLGQRGSLVLGGYDENHILGDIAVFEGPIQSHVCQNSLGCGTDGASPICQARQTCYRRITLKNFPR